MPSLTLLTASPAVTADGQATTVTEATLETGLKLPSLVVPVGFGEVRVSVVPAVGGEGV